MFTKEYSNISSTGFMLDGVKEDSDEGDEELNGS